MRCTAFARRLAAVAAAACLLGSCTAGEQTDGATQGTASTTPPDSAADDTGTTPTGTPTGRPTGGGLPDRLASEPGVLARQLAGVLAVLRDTDAPPAEVRRAGELHQLAVHRLVGADEGFRRRALGGLRPSLGDQLRLEIRAGALLRGLTAPQPRLPDWRIVAPPPPSLLLDHYRAAERRLGVPWEYLAAIHLVETRMGRIRGTSTAGAQGPMQFIPSTWDLYGEGGDVNDPGDAIMAAARLLRAHGAPGDMAAALYHYNPHEYYVRAVTEYATVMQERSRAYHGYWHWQVLYRHERGTYVLPVGYPGTAARLLR